MQPIVELANVTKQFGPVAAVRDLNLQVRAGEFLTLLGPSGCGKTTILRLISGFETPSSGEIFIEGRDVTNVPPYRRDVNQVFQSYALFPHLSVRDNIAFGLKMKKLPRSEIEARIAAVIEMVSLAGLENRKPSQLSGGQKQRVALARALVCQPRVLLLDEPLSALDAKLRRAMQIELKRLQQKLAITFVFVTHDQEEAMVMSDRVAVMNDGRIEQLGDVASIYHHPRTPFVAGFLGQANILEGELMSRETGGPCVRLAAGLELTANIPQKPAGEKLLISIRPEKIHLQRQPSSNTNVFPARIEEELFKGAISQLILRTGSGLELTAIVANESAAEEQFHLGDHVFCRIHADNIVIL
jgi:spermidine/putrescine transport system ATP-binding protein